VKQEIEDILKQRAQLEAENEAMRQECEHLQRQSEQYARLIMANSAKQHTINTTITANNRVYYDLGTRLEKLSGKRRITSYTINRQP